MKELPEDKIKRIAIEASKEVLAAASVTAATLQSKTSTDIEWIRSDIKDIKEKLDQKYTSREEHENLVADYHAVKEDHEDRLRILERYGFAALGVLYVSTIIIGWYIAGHHIN